MDHHGVSFAVVHAEYEFGDPADALNDSVAQLVTDNPRLFAGFGTVTLQPLQPMRAAKQVDGLVANGLMGVNIQPSFFGVPIDDRALYPLYTKAAEHGIAVALHTGINYTATYPIRNDHPLQLDQVACDFPGLRLIACHAGWPWTSEMAAVARKHPSVYLDFGGLAPKYVGAQGTGWEVIYRLMNSLLQNQVLFASDWPIFPVDRSLAEWRELGLKPEVLQSLLADNGNRLLGELPGCPAHLKDLGEAQSPSAS